MGHRVRFRAVQLRGRLVVLGSLIGALLVVAGAQAAHASTYSDTVLASGAISYLPLDSFHGPSNSNTSDATGVTADWAAQGLYSIGEPGAIKTAPSEHSVHLHPGDYVTSTSGTDAWVAAGVSAEVWFKTAVGFTGPGTVMVANGFNQGGSLLLQINSSGKLAASALYNSFTTWQAATATSTSVVSDQQWHHAVMTADASGVQLFLDGALAATGSAPFAGFDWAVEKNTQVCLGGCGGANTGFDGWVDDLAFYTRVVSLSDERADYAAAGWPPPKLVLTDGPLGRFAAGSPSVGCPVCQQGDPVTLPFGTFSHSWTDFAVPGRGVPLNLSHTYSTNLASQDGPLGFGETFSYNMSLSNPGSTDVTVNEESGTRLDFVQQGSSYVPSQPHLVQATLTHNGDGTWTFVRRNTQSFTFNASGQLTQETDLNGYHTNLAYDGNGHLSTVTDPAGRVLTFGWTGSHITQVSDSSSPARVAHFAYDGAGNLQTYTDVASGQWTFTYDSAHRLLTMLDPREQGTTHYVTNHYDAFGRVDWQTDQTGAQTSFDYTSVANGVVTTLPGNTTGNVRPEKTLEVFSDNVPTSVTKGYQAAAPYQSATWNYTYDANVGEVASVQDPNLHTTTYTYDAAGNLTRTQDALGLAETASYNAFNEPLTVTDRMSPSVTTTYTYDSAGNMLSKSTPRDATHTSVWTYRYGEAGRGQAGDLTSMSDPDHPYGQGSKQWLYSYDTYGNRVSATDPAGDTTATCYSPSVGAGSWPTASVTARGTLGGVTCASSAPAAYTTYFNTYSPFGDLMLTTDPNGHTLQRTYDANRNVHTSTDQDGHQTSYVYDYANRLTEMDRADTSKVKTAYWPDGSLLSQTDAANAATLYDYDPLGRQIKVTDPLGNVTQYGYDGAGNLVTKTDPGGTCTAPKLNCTTNSYDNDNRLISIDYSDPSTPDVTNITYDNDGRRLSLTQSNSVNSSWSYDKLGNLLTSSDGSSGTIGYGYDDASNNTTVTYPGTNHTVTRHVDDAGRVDWVQDWNNNKTTFGHADGDNNITSTNFGSGTQTDTYGLDSADRLMSTTMTKSSTTVASLTYGRDNAGLFTTATVGGSSGSAVGPNESYGYNTLNQISTSNGVTSWTYDPADNLTKSLGNNQTFNAGNQLCFSTTQAGGTCASPPASTTTSFTTSYTYDAKGERTAATNSSEWASFVYGSPGDQAVVGDWNGDGQTSVAVYRGTTFSFYLNNNNNSGAPFKVTALGNNGDIPLAGHFWSATGGIDIGVYRPSINTFFLAHGTDGTNPVAISYGQSGDIPIVGDWNGDGITTIGVIRGNQWLLRNSNSAGFADLNFNYGNTTDKFVAGDWDGNGTSTAGVLRNGTWYLTNSTTGGASDIVVTYSDPSGATPVAGDWDGTHTGQGSNHIQTPGSYDSSAATYRLHGTNRLYAYNGAGELCWYTPTANGTTPTCGATPAGTNVTSYGYNGDGLRTSKTGSAGTTNFTWNKTSGLPLLLSEATGSTTTYYIYGPDGLPIESIDQAGTVTWFHHDQLGSTRLLTKTDGTIVAGYSYDPYGTRTQRNGTLVTPFGYAGQYTDPETGLQYLQARYYDPATGQFLTRDPLTVRTGDPFGYGSRSPLNFVDPTGMLGWDDVTGAVDTVVGNAQDLGNSAVETVGGFVEDNIDVIGAGFGCAVGLGTAEFGIGVAIASATCVTAFGFVALGRVSGDPTLSRPGAAYGCGTGTVLGLLEDNPFVIGSGLATCVFGIGSQIAGERRAEQQAAGGDCAPPRERS